MRFLGRVRRAAERCDLGHRPLRDGPPIGGLSLDAKLGDHMLYTCVPIMCRYSYVYIFMYIYIHILYIQLLYELHIMCMLVIYCM